MPNCISHQKNSFSSGNFNVMHLMDKNHTKYAPALEIYLLTSIFLCVGISFFIYLSFDVDSRLLAICKCIAIVIASQIISFFLSSTLDIFNMRNSNFIFDFHVIPISFLFPLLLLKGWVTIILVIIFSLIISPAPKNRDHKTKETQ